MRIAIIGNSIVSNLGALYFRKQLPAEAEIYIVGPDDRGGIPVVGESTIEITAQFLENQLGLGQYLRKHHYPKYALTYYFKLDPESPNDRTYSVHCNEREPVDLTPLPSWEGPMARPPSWQLNREVFDRDLIKMVRSNQGIRHIDGLVKNIILKGQNRHLLTVKVTNGAQFEIDVDWVIDASGRKRLLARKLGLTIKPEKQRDVFWFRLADFDRDLLKNLNALGPKPPMPGEDYHYDRYYSTHHFMGRGNWIWMIPLRTEDKSELISIGFVSRPDVYDGEVKSMTDFLDQVEQVHPVVTDFVRSGRVVDTNRMRRYHYVSSQVYSVDRWAIIGDAAFAPDPLFSNGLAFSTIQLEQLGFLLQQDLAGRHDSKEIKELSDAFLAPVLASQSAISTWYESMHDAFLSSLRLHWIEVSYFYMLLPMVVNLCHYDPDMRWPWRVFQFRDGGENGFEIPETLVEARNKFEKPTPEYFIYRGKEKVNLRALEKVSDATKVVSQIKEGVRLLRCYVRDVLDRIDRLSANKMISEVNPD